MHTKYFEKSAVLRFVTFITWRTIYGNKNYR